MKTIQAIGDFFAMDKDGFLLNPCLNPPFGYPWDPMMETITSFLSATYPGLIHSIWLRGSVARGTGVPGQSDLDTFVLIKKAGFHWQELPEVAALKALLGPLGEADFPLECQLESYTGKPEGLRSQIAMLIATQSVCIWGEDIRPFLKEYKPGKEVMLENRWLAADVAAFLEKIEKGETWDKAAFCSFMKTIIRAGFELVMERDGRYTRDLYPAYQAFSTYYPERESDMRQALHWYLNPMPDHVVFKAYLLDFGEWLGESLRV
jgi:predicted nucleotidyltransferase